MCRCTWSNSPLLPSLLLATLCFSAADAQPIAPEVPSGALPDSVLHYLLHAEPNRQLQLLGNVSDLEGGSLKRTFLHSGHRRAALLIQRWMVEAGMISWIDAVGNVRGRAPSTCPTAPALLTGSHYDTVVDGGKFDGALGIVTGVAAVKAALLDAAVASGALPLDAVADAVQAALGARGPQSSSRRLDLRQLLGAAGGGAALPRPVEVAAFSDEEGIRFQSTFLGSRALAGSLIGSGLLGSRDAAGLNLQEALAEAGMDASVEGIGAAALQPVELAAYVEVHMEQGPVLQESGRRLGVVTAIAGQTRLHVAIRGVQGHAGTVPMALRHDPLAAAAELIVQLERLCGGGGGSGGGGSWLPSGGAAAESESVSAAAPEGGGAGSGLVCTVGSIAVWPNAPNVIPGRANFTVDIRSQWDGQREAVVAALRGAAADVCARRGVACALETRHEAAAVHSAGEVVAQLARAVEESAATLERVLALQRRQGGRGGQGEAPPQGAAGQGAGAQQAQQAGTCAAGNERDAQASADAASCQAGPLCTADPAGCGAAAAAGDPAAPGPPAVQLLVSGAGHDAMALANVTRMGMLFVRCRDGISHSPLEHVAPDDVAAGVAALYQYMSSWVSQAGTAQR